MSQLSDIKEISLRSFTGQIADMAAQIAAAARIIPNVIDRTIPVSLRMLVVIEVLICL